MHLTETQVKAEKSVAFGDGMQLGARVENRVAVEAIVTALLRVLGKDKGDGVIDLGAAGRWYPASDYGFATKED